MPRKEDLFHDFFGRHNEEEPGEDIFGRNFFGGHQEKELKNKFNNRILEREMKERDKRQWQGVWDNGDLNDIRANIRIPQGLPDFRIIKTLLERRLPAHTVEEIGLLARSEPQKDEAGNYRWLATGGLAVEMVTGDTRHHHDVDIVIIDTNSPWWLGQRTDNVTPQQYWAGMNFQDGFLSRTARTATVKIQGQERQVASVHPAVLLVQKLSNAFGRDPRLKDEQDVRALVRHWINKEGATEEWDTVCEAAVQALPAEEQERTKNRLEPHMQAVRRQREMTVLGMS